MCDWVNRRCPRDREKAIINFEAEIDEIISRAAPFDLDSAGGCGRCVTICLRVVTSDNVLGSREEWVDVSHRLDETAPVTVLGGAALRHNRETRQVFAINGCRPGSGAGAFAEYSCICAGRFAVDDGIISRSFDM